MENPPREIPPPSVSEGQGESRPLPEPTRAAAAPDYVDRIRSHPDLPPAMRERLAELVQRQPPDEGPRKIPLDDVLAILAETVPSNLRLDASELPVAPHPEGESFFSGDPASDAERQAAEVASEQLALSGLLRKP
jgi:hypothetical protein